MGPLLKLLSGGLVVVTMLVLCALQEPVYAEDVNVGFYADSCPNAEAIVTSTVQQAVQGDRGIAASLLRLFFHDCFSQGCDGSILLDPTASNPNPEKVAAPNLSVRGYEVIDQAKTLLEQACPQVVSCADIVALAARDSVVLSGLIFDNQGLDMATGRFDGRVSNAQDALNNIVSSKATTADLTQRFGQKGLSQDEMITLSGAHTIGVAHCNQITDRLYNFPGSANGVDPTLDPTYAAQLQASCPATNANPSTTVFLDPVTPFVMDNNYYNNGLAGRVLFPSDQTLFADQQTQFASTLNSQIGQEWSQKFGDALARMSLIDVKDQNSGEIRRTCRSVN